jgi:hypothetical protein
VGAHAGGTGCPREWVGQVGEDVVCGMTEGSFFFFDLTSEKKKNNL